MSSASTATAVFPGKSPWWPGVVVAVLTGVGLWYVTRQPWFASIPALSFFEDWGVLAVIPLAVWQLATLAVDARKLAVWRRTVARFDTTDPQRDATWVYQTYQEARRTLPNRYNLEDVHKANRDRRRVLSNTLTSTWLFKYYLAAFGIPLIGLLLGLLSLRTQAHSLPFPELFPVLIVGSLVLAGVLFLALTLARQAKQTLENWEHQANELAAEEVGRRKVGTASESPVGESITPEPQRVEVEEAEVWRRETDAVVGTRNHDDKIGAGAGLAEKEEGPPTEMNPWEPTSTPDEVDDEGDLHNRYGLR